jgi:hypothetical protein
MVSFNVLAVSVISVMVFLFAISNQSFLVLAPDSILNGSNISIISNPPAIQSLFNITNAKVINKEQFPSGVADFRINPSEENGTIKSVVGYVFDKQIWICEYDDNGNWVGCDTYDLK